jgi:ppGpp synthetase/RelA/SpoT-type nucleotidyltranferase
MPDSTYSLHDKTLALIEATTWSQEGQQTFVKEIWPKLEDDYEGMVAKLEKRCKEIIRNKGIAAMVESRVKTRDSIEKSLNRRSQYRLEKKQPACRDFNELLNEIHDLAGIRIVVDLPHNLETASALISATKAFLAKEDPIEFKANRSVGKLWKHWFGAYECVNHHVTAQFPARDTLQCYNDVLFEIQVTTLAASLYNKIAHPLHYKNQAGESSRRDEIVIDLTRGLSLCYSLCLYYKDDKLSTGDIEFMRRHASIHQGKRSESILEDSGMMLPGVPELQRKGVKDVPTSMLQRTLDTLSLRPGEATLPRLWDSFVHNMRYDVLYYMLLTLDLMGSPVPRST